MLDTTPQASEHPKAIIMHKMSNFLDSKWEFVEYLMCWVLLALQMFQMCVGAAPFRISKDFVAEDEDNLEVVMSSHAWDGFSRAVQVVAYAVGRQARC